MIDMFECLGTALLRRTTGATKERIRELAEAVARSEKELADYLEKKASEEAFDKWLNETAAKIAAEGGTDYSRN